MITLNAIYLLDKKQKQVIKEMAKFNDPTIKSYKKLANEKFPEVIERDVGLGAELLSWDSQYFTNIGENYIGKVKHVLCKVKYQNAVIDRHYIVKLNPRRKIEVFQSMTNSFFVKEAKFLTEVTPELNKILTVAGCSTLCVPQCLFVNLEKNNEIILFKDLRRQSFKVHRRLEPLDLKHSVLFMKEIARQHASSYILYLRKKRIDLAILYPFMEDYWLHEENVGATQYVAYCRTRFSSAIYALEKLQESKMALAWLKREEENLFRYFVESWEKSDDRFKVICHGDCWTSNMMFRYDKDGTPLNIILIDYQQCRVASLITDIHIFLITTTTGDTRKLYLEYLLKTYYHSFIKVFKGARERVPFTLSELHEEYANKTMFACLAGIIKLPLVLSEDKETTDINAVDEETFPLYLEKQKPNLIKMLKENPEIKKRYLSLFDSTVNNGPFN